MTVTAQTSVQRTRIWVCVVCDHVYYEDAGDPDHGIAPGTRFEDIADDWVCPDCGVGKSDFVLFGN